MAKYEHQHFIPRSYLNNFANKVDDEKFRIHAWSNQAKEIKYISTTDVCTETNLYTIPTKTGGKRFDLEHFYADKIDGVYPLVYKILKDDNIKTIDFNTRLKIITTTFSFFFRTPKFLNQLNQELEKLIWNILKHEGGDEYVLRIFGEEVKLTKIEVQQIIKERKEQNRILFLVRHMESYEKFVQSKLHDAISIYNVVDGSELITCDNPVVIRPYANPLDPKFSYDKYYAQEINPFNPNNIIQLALDKKTLLLVMPNNANLSPELVFRNPITLKEVVIYNNEIEKYAERWLLGSKEGIENYFTTLSTLNAETPENLKMVDDYRERTRLVFELLEIMESKGIDSDDFKNRIEELKQNPIMENDQSFKNFIK